MKFYYRKSGPNYLLNLLSDNAELRKTLAYMATFKMYNNLKVKPYDHSILLYNDEINIIIIIYVDFLENEYLEKLPNTIYVSLKTAFFIMYEYKNIDIEVRYVNINALLYTTIELSKNKYLTDLKILLRVNDL